MLPDFYQVLKGFRGLYWVLLGFTRFFWVLLKFLPGFTGFYRVSQGFLQQCSLDLTGSLWIVPSFTDITGFYWVLPSLTNLRTDPNWKRSSDSSCLAISCSRTAVHLSTSNEKKNIKKKTKKETREKKRQRRRHQTESKRRNRVATRWRGRPGPSALGPRRRTPGGWCRPRARSTTLVE